MTLIIDCPSCARKLRVPSDLLGLKVKCPSCATMFTATDTSSAPPPAESAPPPPGPPSLESEPAAAAPPFDPFAPPPPGAMPEDTALRPAPPKEDDRRPCPSCQQSIPIEATRCRYCGEPVNRDPDDDDRPWERPYHANLRRDSEPHRGTMVLVFGILSIVLGTTWFLSLVSLPMGIAAWVMGSRDLRKMRMNQMDPQGEGMTQAGWICGIIGTIISGLFGLCCAGYIFVIIFAIASSPGGPAGPARPTNRPTKFSAPAENVPLRLPTVPNIQ
jgi:predicted Zn finger-like uncharacterized protein